MLNDADASPRYRVTATPPGPGAQVWLLLSQHQTSKNVPLDDVALLVFRDHDFRRSGHDDRGRRLSMSHQDSVS